MPDPTPPNGLPNWRILARGLRFPEGPVAMADGSVILVEIARGTVTRVAPDGTVSVVATTGGGPNGAAIGPDGALYVCNNGGFVWRTVAGLLCPGEQPPDYEGGRIERVDLKTGAVRVLYERCDGLPLRGPNDIVFDANGGFYFTDLGKDHAREHDHGSLYYARADGTDIVEIAHPVITPNGIGLSPDGGTLYFAETDTARLWAFEIPAPGVVRTLPFPGSPNRARFVGNLAGLHLFDSLAVEASGNICVTTPISGGVAVFSPAGEELRRVPMGDYFTTNICFGGPDMRTAYVTLSGTGMLAAMDWPVPGLRLNYQD